MVALGATVRLILLPSLLLSRGLAKMGVPMRPDKACISTYPCKWNDIDKYETSTGEVFRSVWDGKIFFFYSFND